MSASVPASAIGVQNCRHSVPNSRGVGSGTTDSLGPSLSLTGIFSRLWTLRDNYSACPDWTVKVPNGCDCANTQQPAICGDTPFIGPSRGVGTSPARHPKQSFDWHEGDE